MFVTAESLLFLLPTKNKPEKVKWGILSFAHSLDRLFSFSLLSLEVQEKTFFRQVKKNKEVLVKRSNCWWQKKLVTKKVGHEKKGVNVQEVKIFLPPSGSSNLVFCSSRTKHSASGRTSCNGGTLARGPFKKKNMSLILRIFPLRTPNFFWEN